jgi:hypothetical protein
MARRLWAKNVELTGRLGDGWTPSYGYAPTEQIPRMQQTIDQSLAAAERKVLLTSGSTQLQNSTKIFEWTALHSGLLMKVLNR